MTGSERTAFRLPRSRQLHFNLISRASVSHISSNTLGKVDSVVLNANTVARHQSCRLVCLIFDPLNNKNITSTKQPVHVCQSTEDRPKALETMADKNFNPETCIKLFDESRPRGSKTIHDPEVFFRVQNYGSLQSNLINSDIMEYGQDPRLGQELI